MKNKFKYLVSFSLKKKINTKWFKVVNIFLCILLIFLVNMDYIINLFGGDFNKENKIYVVDNTDNYESFVKFFDAFASTTKLESYEIVSDKKIINELDKIDNEIVLVIEKSEEEYIDATIISYEAINKNTYDVIVATLNSLKSEMVYLESGLTQEEISNLTSPVNIEEKVLNNDAKDNETKENLSAIITTVLIVPFFILIVTMVQMIGAEINDEKTTRGMEVIISSIPAKMHFLSKVISSISYVLIQGLLLFVYMFIAIIFKNVFTTSSMSQEVSGIFSETIKMLNDANVFELLAQGSIVLIVLFIVSFLAYAILSATLASMTTNNEDFQQLQTPLMIIMLLGYYIALMAVVFNGSIFINILAHIPLLSVMIAPTLYLLGEMSLLSLALSTLITIITTYFLYKYGLKIYKVGILNYSSNKLWKKMFKSLKNKN